MKTCTIYRCPLTATITCISLAFVIVGFIPYSHGEAVSNNNALNMLYPLDSKPFGIGHRRGRRLSQNDVLKSRVIHIVTDTTWENCALDQAGPIWFLAGTAGGLLSCVVDCTCKHCLQFFPLVANECLCCKFEILNPLHN